MALPSRPIDASVSVVFNSGGMTGTNSFTVYFREAVVDYITMIELNQYTMGELNGSPLPNQGDAKWEPRNLSTLEGRDVSEFEGITMRELERQEDFNLLSNFGITVEWGATPGTSIYGIDSEGHGQSFLDVGDLTTATIYVALLDVWDHSWRARIFPTAAGVIDDAHPIFDTGEVNDDFHVKRRRGTLRLAESLVDGTADVIEMRTRHLNFAEYRSKPLQSHTPVEGCQIYAEYTPGVQRFASIVAGPNGGTYKLDKGKSLSGESYKITNIGLAANQGVQSNVIQFENFSDYRVEFDIWYPQNAIDTGNPVELFLRSTSGGNSAVATVSAATDFVTLNGHGYVNGQRVVLTDIATGAAGLTEGTVYYVRDKTANTFKLAAIAGGAAINVTSDGTGLHFDSGLVKINLGHIQGDSWHHVKLYPVEGNRLLTGGYQLYWRQAATGQATVWWLDNIKVIEESMRWEARAVQADPWGDREGVWTHARDLINSEQNGILFHERGSHLQVRGKALRQDVTLGKVKVKPKYAELGRPVFEPNISRQNLLGDALQPAPMVLSATTFGFAVTNTYDRVYVNWVTVPPPIHFYGSADNVNFTNIGAWSPTELGWQVYEFPQRPSFRYFRMTSDGGGNFQIYGLIIRPALLTPTAAFTPTVAGGTVLFDASASSDPDGFLIGYVWNFGDGSQGFGKSVKHTYDQTGVGYNVTLVVTDNNGLEATTTQEVGV